MSAIGLYHPGRRIALINPNLVLQTDDIFTTGIVYMPVGLASFAASWRAAGNSCQVIDGFGEKPRQWWREGNFVFRGLTPREVADRIDPDVMAIVLYAINLTYHRSLVQILKAVRQRFSVPVLILENTQAVTAYSVRKIQEEFYDQGVDYVITGEGEIRGVRLLEAIARGETPELDGIGYRRNGKTVYSPPIEKIAELDRLPFPAWDLFPLKNYWKLKYSHGPLSATKYLPLLTSRGCPYACRFCVIPETNAVTWRARTARNVVEEMEHWLKEYGVREFHFEDVDPTVSDVRIREFCNEILARKLDVIWKLCSGTKVETIRSEETLELMWRAGCRYISISPESGSARVMKLINKPFKADHALKLIRKMNQLGIKSQACFVLGFPGEEDEDRQLTRQMAQQLTKAGLDEIALFVITPVPGSKIFDQFRGYTEYSQLNFSPTWRADYEALNRFRLALYRDFLFWKVRYHPFKLCKQPLNFLARRFETKMEMTPYRAAQTFFMLRGARGSEVHP